jgi:signal transduction histidine kinase
LVGASETAAQTHAVLRARSAFDINQLASEYRALRASVLRLWMDDRQQLAGTDLEDVIRFNEAIDQALAESIGHFSAQVDQARNLLLGMLGHDMRSPLQTIQVTSSYLAALNAGQKVSEAAARLINSGAQMKALLDDLVDFSRTHLGLGINAVPTDVDLAHLFRIELDQLRGAHPGHVFDLEVVGETRGIWDGRRLRQLLDNLVINAIKYGAPAMPVRVAITGAEAEVRIEVRNFGPVIEPSMLEHIFNPLLRGAHRENDPDSGDSLGLGLYIAREIAKAHGGDITARSNSTETVFTVRLPRRTR